MQGNGVAHANPRPTLARGWDLCLVVMQLAYMHLDFPVLPYSIGTFAGARGPSNSCVHWVQGEPRNTPPLKKTR